MTATSPPPTRRALAAPGLILALAAATVALAGCGHHATGPTLQRAIITTAHVR